MRRKTWVLCMAAAAMLAAGCAQKDSKKTEAQTEKLEETKKETKEETTAEKTTEETTAEETTVEETTEETTEEATAEKTTEQETGTESAEEPAESEEESTQSVSEAGREAIHFLEEMYAKVDEEMLPWGIQNTELDLTDSELLMYQSGLKEGDKLESVILSESMLSSTAYSVVYAVPKEGESAEKILDEMMKNMNPSKWICVTADYMYGVTFDNNAFVVMADKEMSDLVYQAAVDTAKEQGLKVGKRKS